MQRSGSTLLERSIARSRRASNARFGATPPQPRTGTSKNSIGAFYATSSRTTSSTASSAWESPSPNESDKEQHMDRNDTVDYLASQPLSYFERLSRDQLYRTLADFVAAGHEDGAKKCIQ